MAADDISADLCSVNGCSRLIASRGWCGLHYARWRRDGDPLLLETKRATRLQAREAKAAIQAQVVAGYASLQPVQCEGCGHSFQRQSRGNRDNRRFCSRECSFQWQKSFAAQRVAMPKPLRCCTSCDKPVGSRQFLCTPCKGVKASVSTYVAKQKVERSCEGCSVPIKGTAAKRLCGLCIRKKARSKNRHLRKHRDRARHFGVRYEPVSALAVFDRDGWRCQVCGVKTPSRLRGSSDPKAPELDHRIPISKGGDHAWNNLQCCCRACNGSKGSRLVVGQLNLFPVAA
jgi:5-methylcytosine-specific restriction endonuclease McrA